MAEAFGEGLSGTWIAKQGHRNFSAGRSMVFLQYLFTNEFLKWLQTQNSLT
jgi:hypothetical protein